MSITVAEIAKLAGVSRGTVDRALKNRAGISPQTKECILAIAKKYDYKPNLIGKALVYSGKTINLQVLLNSVGNPFFDEIKNGIFAAANEYASYGIKISLSEFKGYDGAQLLHLLNHLPEGTENIILTPICQEAVEQKINALLEAGTRVVTLSSALENAKGALYVGCDYLKSGRVAGRLVGLLSAGNANLFVVTGSVLHKGHQQRVEGIRQIVTKEYPDVHFLGVAENQDDDAIAYATMKGILKKYPEIDFVYITAGGVNGTLRALREHERPIRACAFDDTAVAKEALLDGTILATICQQPFEQGYQAVKMFFDNIIAKKDRTDNIYSELSIKVDQSL